ncbi:MAG: bifunctional isocitrate dehydrogenase kinase/phosphatase, partial [Gammaproteobacteria bacterium]|nr:bifunctional isocitrate dehydrogenase kinase/phosphatase [Gammaproteobacteria bacterium]
TGLNTVKPDANLMQHCAREIFNGFLGYNQDFRSVTLRAKARFESQNWYASQRDQAKRIELYDEWVWRLVEEMREELGRHASDPSVWAQIKSAYVHEISEYQEQEFTKTYYNSITRRLFKTEGTNPQVEFVALDLDPIKNVQHNVPSICYRYENDLQSLFAEVLDNYAFKANYIDKLHSAEFLSDQVKKYNLDPYPERELHHVEIIQAVFYQNTRAYLVGKIVFNSTAVPFAIALKNIETGIKVDAVVQTQRDFSILFGYTRSYFHVDLETVSEMVDYLHELLPHKPVAELFTVLGRAKQGKTERYRDLMQHMETAKDQFIIAPGDAGLVMAVFTLPSYDVVFKVIRDKFGYPKTSTRKEVMQRYQLVFKKDRAGRLVDAQEFRHLRFKLDRFEQKLLDELLKTCGNSVEIQNEYLLIKHSYIERRMQPLNLYLQQCDDETAEDVIVDFGQSIKDLAANNIFPGDLLLKNFGVTSNRRVIFYDYDELCLLQECNFRKFPKARSYEQQMASDAWFYVADNDVFPEQFTEFLGLEGRSLEVFMQHHADVLDFEFWKELQAKHEEDALIEFLPYRNALATERLS